MSGWAAEGLEEQDPLAVGWATHGGREAAWLRGEVRGRPPWW